MKVFGLNFSQLSVDEIAKQLASSKNLLTVFTVNVDHVVKMRKSAVFRSAYKKASIVTADGFPIYIYACMRGISLPGRVTGADLFSAVLIHLLPERHKPFFVVSDDETAARLEGVLIERGFSGNATIVPPFGFERDIQYSEALARKVGLRETTHLFLCVGAPKSEIWLDQYRQLIGPCHALAFGMGANFFVGTAQRAPRWLQRIGGEWFWRFLREPRRLFGRYFVDSWSFFLAIVDDLARKENL